MTIQIQFIPVLQFLEKCILPLLANITITTTCESGKQDCNAYLMRDLDPLGDGIGYSHIQCYKNTCSTAVTLPWFYQDFPTMPVSDD